MSEHERAKDLAAGKWRSILPMLGIPATYLDGKHHRCPANGEGKDRFRFADREGTGSFFCNCSHGEKGGIGLVMCCKHLSYADACKEVERVAGCDVPMDEAPSTRDGKRRLEVVRKAMEEIQPDGEVSAYLRGRALKVPPTGLARARLDYYETGTRGKRGTYDAMVAVMRGRDGKPQSLHVTYIQNGKKAPVSCPRKILCGGYEPGSAVRLFPVAEHIGIGEGIETSLAAAELFDLPTWAAINEGNMRRFRPPVEVKRVSVFGDKDGNYAGQAAAYCLANELERMGVACDVYLPTQPGKCDWNDVLISQRVAK